LDLPWHSDNPAAGRLVFMEFDASHKLLLIGDSLCGKSALVTRFADAKFDAAGQATVGVDFKISSFRAGDKRIRLHIWDSTGNRRFRSITTSYYRVAHAVLVCFDTTSASSFESVSEWLQAVNDFCAAGTPVLLVGTKAEIVDGRAISRQAAELRAASIGAKYYETSAATGEGVREAFIAAADAVSRANAQRKSRRALIRTGAETQTYGCCLSWLNLKSWLATTAASAAQQPQRIATAELVARAGRSSLDSGVQVG
jgi:small GTP-binding protein